MNVRVIFNAAASEYDAARPRLIPCIKEFYGTALELISFEYDAEFSVLNLGVGKCLAFRGLFRECSWLNWSISDQDFLLQK